MDDVYQATLTKSQEIRLNGYRLVEKWEHELDKELREDPEMSQFFHDMTLPEPLDPRDALRVGRKKKVFLKKCFLKTFFFRSNQRHETVSQMPARGVHELL